MPYGADQIFDVVNDIASYPAFLPWCTESRVLEESETSMTAQLTIARSGIRQSFTTRNILSKPEKISLALVDGPFKSLQGNWAFRQLGADGCKVEMNLSFEVDSRVAGALLGTVFEKAADTLVDAFCQRAQALYG